MFQIMRYCLPCSLLDQVIDLRNKRKGIVSVCLEETGGLGVDCFLDDGGMLTFICS